MTDRLAFLAAPLPREPGVPLRAQVHSRILDGIRGGRLTPGSMIPTEAEIGRLLGVSRTVVREALMLLDEDGFIVSRRGIGRFVADALPQIGLERLRAIEQLLDGPGVRVELRRTEAVHQQSTTTFVAEELGVGSAWFFETVLLRDGRPVALTQEHLATGGPLPAAATDGVAAGMASPGGTLLAVLTERFRVGAGVARLTAGVLGPARALPLDADPAEPVLIVTQTARLNGAPLYLAKHVLRAEAGQLAVMQSAM